MDFETAKEVLEPVLDGFLSRNFGITFSEDNEECEMLFKKYLNFARDKDPFWTREKVTFLIFKQNEVEESEGVSFPSREAVIDRIVEMARTKTAAWYWGLKEQSKELIPSLRYVAAPERCRVREYAAHREARHK